MLCPARTRFMLVSPRLYGSTEGRTQVPKVVYGRTVASDLSGGRQAGAGQARPKGSHERCRWYRQAGVGSWPRGRRHNVNHSDFGGRPRAIRSPGKQLRSIEAGIAELANQSCFRRLEWLPVGVPDAADALSKLRDSREHHSVQQFTTLYRSDCARHSTDVGRFIHRPICVCHASKRPENFAFAIADKRDDCRISVPSVGARGSWYAEFEYCFEQRKLHQCPVR